MIFFSFFSFTGCNTPILDRVLGKNELFVQFFKRKSTARKITRIYVVLLSIENWTTFLIRIEDIPMFFVYEYCLSFPQIDRDHCTPNPCQNGGQCLNTPDDYYCQCSGNGWSWHGKNCTVPYDSGVVNNAAKTTVTVAMMTTAGVRSTTPTSTIPSERSTTTVRRTSTIGSGTTDGQQQRNDENNNSKSK